jgi:hypothetical protein
VLLRQKWLIVSCPNMSVHVSLHSLAVCDWAHLLTVFVVIKFSCPHYVENVMKCLSHV